MIPISGIPKGAQIAISDMLDSCANIQPGQEVLLMAQIDGLYGGDNLVDKEAKEMAILKTYMPAQMSREEVVAEAKAIISEVGAKGPSDKGKVMGKLVAKLKGKADGQMINTVVTDLLSKM